MFQTLDEKAEYSKYMFLSLWVCLGLVFFFLSLTELKTYTAFGEKPLFPATLGLAHCCMAPSFSSSG